MEERAFDIGETVYHISPESPKGLVLNAYYNLKHKEWTYLVNFGLELDNKICVEEELSLLKTF